MAFELATADYLFDPHASDNITRDEDHLAHFIELLGPIPSSIIFNGRNWHKFFDENGRLDF